MTRFTKYGEYSYVLKNQNGLAVHFLSIGAAIQRILIPDQNNEVKNLVLTFQNESDYLNNPLYFGATLGPCAGRIQNGVLPIANHPFTLDQNDGNNHLHGGSHSISFQNWSIFHYSDNKDSSSITFELFLPNGLDGYPGNRTIRVTYHLDDNNRLSIRYYAISDQTTYFNLSNHVYFNLFADIKKSLDQMLSINADYYVANNKEHLPLKSVNISDTPFDFKSPKSLHSQIASYPNDEQLLLAKGYNHSFIMNHSKDTPSASLWNNEEHIGINLYTDAKCLLLYSGGFIENNYKLEHNISTQSSCGIALEAQDFPNAPNFLDFDYILTKPGEIYSRTICYEVLWKL